MTTLTISALLLTASYVVYRMMGPMAMPVRVKKRTVQRRDRK